MNTLKGSQDLTKIKGIGPVRQTWLRKEFDIQTYQDLGGLPASIIEEHLKRDGHKAPLDIDSWLTQARKLAADSFSLESAAAKYRENGWQPSATFVVEFQKNEKERKNKQRVVAHHIEKDKTIKWSKLNEGQIFQWISNQIGPKKEIPSSAQRSDVKEVAQIKRTKPAVKSKPKLKSNGLVNGKIMPASLRVNHIQTFQPPKVSLGTLERDRASATLIQSQMPFKLKVYFDVTNPPLSKSAFTAQFFVHNLETGEGVFLGQSKPKNLHKNKEQYSATLSKVTLPAGRYQLRVWAKKENQPTFSNIFEVPLLQIVN